MHGESRHRGHRARRSAGVHPRVSGALQGRAGRRAAALLRRPGRLLRLRHGALHRAASCAPAGASRTRSARPTSCCCCPRRSRSSTTSPGKLYLVVYADPRKSGRVRLRRRRACANCSTALRAPVRDSRAPGARSRSQPHSNFGEATFTAGGGEGQALHLRRRHHAGACCRSASRGRFAAEPLALYRALRTLNPSPYMFYLRLRRLPRRRRVARDPGAAGRRQGHAAAHRRHAPPRRDARGGSRRSRAELLADPKERAEHVMLVDLGRNDVGRVAETGTVQRHRAHGDRALLARDAHRLERRGHAAPGPRRASTCCARRFPAGTVTGAPKVRAMEIIDELEPVQRGIYAGAVGYLGFHGNMDTRHRHPHRAWSRTGRCYVQAGAGIVADSDPRARVAGDASTRRARCCARPRWPQRGLDTKAGD